MLTGANSAILSFLLLCFGGSNDLLDYIPTSTYWQIKQVQITPQAMADELADHGKNVSSLIEQLADPDPKKRADADDRLARMGTEILPQLRAATEQPDPQIATESRDLMQRIGPISRQSAVRRLMAIRALGESGSPQAMAILQPLLKSPQPFEADYAAAAIAALEHRSVPRPSITAADCAADVWAMPRDCAAVLQVRSRGGHPLSVDPIAVLLIGNPAPQAQQAADALHRQLINLAESIGNVRLESATIGISGTVDPLSAYMAIIFRGQYDPTDLTAFLHAQAVHRYLVADTDMYEANFNWLFIPGDDRIEVVFGPVHAPLTELVNAAIYGKGTLHESAPMAPLLAAVDVKDPFWGVANMTPSFRRLAPVFAPFRTLRLQGSVQYARLKLNLTAAGDNAAAAQASSAVIDDFMQTTQKQLSALPPMFGPLLGAIASVQSQTVGGKISVSADIPPSLLDEMLAAGAPALPK